MLPIVNNFQQLADSLGEHRLNPTNDKNTCFGSLNKAQARASVH